MRVRVERHSDFAVSHHILKHFGTHLSANLVAAERMAADMRCYSGNFLLVDRVELGDDVLEVVLPMQGDRGHPALVQAQKAAHTVDFEFAFRRGSLRDDLSEAPSNIIGHRGKHPG